MEVKLIGALDYDKVRKMLKEKLNVDDNMLEDNISTNINLLNQEISLLESELQDEISSDDKDEIIKSIEILKKGQEYLQSKLPNVEVEEIVKELYEIEKARRSEIVASAGRLSRFAGNVFDIIGLSEEKTIEQNSKFASNVTSMGHDSITDHDYCVFAIKDVSPIVEQTIIEERFSSFTIKSRREVNFANVGFYVPDFHDSEGNVLSNSESIKEEYQKYMRSLFDSYQELVDMGIPVEDARFVLPYCYHSNIIMGMDAHSLKDLIIKLTKTKYANIQELKEFGEKLYEIAKENMPYIVKSIDSYVAKENDPVEEFLENNTDKVQYNIIDQPKLINKPYHIDDTICIAALMRRYQYDYETAKGVLRNAIKADSEFKNKLIRTIAFEGDGLELTQVNFDFQIPLSLAILTHLTRHRTHHLMTPDFVPNLDLSQYKTPPTINSRCCEIYQNIHNKNMEMYNHFKRDYGIREEDLVYFALSGNMVNVITSMDGRTVKHILGLRECSKAQWEARNMAYGMHREIDQLSGADIYSSILGATCTTQGICNEGRECCGKVYKLPNCRMPEKK